MSELIELEDQEELIQNEQEIETAAYKEAFDHFDWNHSGRIPTSVKPVPMQELQNFSFCMIEKNERFSWSKSHYRRVRICLAYQ